MSSESGKLGGLTSILHRYMDQAGITKDAKVQRRVRHLLLRYQQSQLEIKRLNLELDALHGREKVDDHDE